VPFELYNRSQKRLESRLSIHKVGIFVLNEAAYEQLGKPEAVELLFDGERRAIAFRPASKDCPQALPSQAPRKK
jgi:hypothetical protein